ncbi:MAG: Rne/Rng family ribonuclease, partial [Immundisolibacteraceae bacterium]|nr:Rne/Rng family ribonuclease [Immundisolibacteraceae bacterium]
MKRILLNATQTEEIRVAIVDGQYLFDLDIESVAQNKRKSNIYKGTVTRVEPSLEAAFIDYGADRHGFLPLKEVASQLFNEGGGKKSIQGALKEGQQLIVQVEKEERGNKGAALTTQISLAGRYLVLMPRTLGSGGISRKVESRDRDELRAVMNEVTVPEDMSAIARTMALGRNREELQWDLDYLMELWTSITNAAEQREAPFLVYQESNIVSRTIRDYLRNDISELIIDSDEVYAEAVEFMQQLMPQNLNKLKHYEDSIPLFTRYQIEHQIETAHQRSINLRSGGSIVIDHTEALTSIDINSARATQGADIEETAFRTNMEAAEEVARQLRLRDLGGLLVIDFIDMNSNKNQREVENCLRDATKADRARVQIGKISRFGLLEMSRQRLGASLREISAITCPRCDGQGTIRTVESLALHIVRLIEEEAHKERTARISVQVPIPVATFLFNEKRALLADLDNRLGMQAVILPNANLETPHYDIQRTRVQDLNKGLQETLSFDLPVIEAEDLAQQPSISQPEPAAVKPVSRTSPPTKSKQPSEQKGLLSKLFGWMTADNKTEEQNKPVAPANRNNDKRSTRGGGNNRSRGQGNKGGQNNQNNRNDQKRTDSRKPQNSKQQGEGSNRQQNQQKNNNNQQNDSDQKKQQRPPRNDDQQRESSKSGNRRGNRGGRGNKPAVQPTVESDQANQQAATDQAAPEVAETTSSVPEISSVTDTKPSKPEATAVSPAAVPKPQQSKTARPAATPQEDVVTPKINEVVARPAPQPEEQAAPISQLEPAKKADVASSESTQQTPGPSRPVSPVSNVADKPETSVQSNKGIDQPTPAEQPKTAPAAKKPKPVEAAPENVREPTKQPSP